MYQHVEQRIDQVEKNQTELKAGINQVYDLVDEDLKRRETDEQERSAMNHQLERHETWIVRAAKRLGLGYER